MGRRILLGFFAQPQRARALRREWTHLLRVLEEYSTTRHAIMPKSATMQQCWYRNPQQKKKLIYDTNFYDFIISNRSIITFKSVK